MKEGKKLFTIYKNMVEVHTKRLSKRQKALTQTIWYICEVMNNSKYEATFETKMEYIEFTEGNRTWYNCVSPMSQKIIIRAKRKGN